MLGLRTASALVFGAALSLTLDAAPPSSPPNVVLIMVDDMGFSDLSCYGSEIPTPNIDRLAAEGVRFSQFHNAGRCCPTRAAIMTGNYNHFAGNPGMEGPGARYDETTGQRVGGRSNGAILRECPSLGEVFRFNGYQTFIAGKWHIGETKEWQFPLQRGFDKFFGTLRGATPNKFNGAWFWEGNAEIPKPVPNDFYSGNAVGRKALEFVSTRDKSKPFFLYYTPLEPHWPWAAPESDIAPFRGKYDVGYEVLRAARYKRAVELGVLPAGLDFEPHAPNMPSWEEMKKETNIKGLIETAEKHAGMVKNIDDNVGRLIDHLRSEGVLDNTIVMFLSDNGGEVVLGKYFWIWPTVLNSPFRWHKVTAHEGGTATPFIVRWPAGGVPAGKINTGQVGHVIDILPTLLSAIGGEFPKENLRVKTYPPAGESLLAAWRDPARAAPRTLFWEHSGNCAVRDGDWKLVRLYNEEDHRPSKEKKDQQSNPRTGRWELYDMSRDRTEMHDLAAKMPEKVAALSAKFDAWFARMEAPTREEMFKAKIKAQHPELTD